MMNDVYTCLCPEDRVLKMQQVITNTEHFKDVANTVEFHLLKCYISHRISDSIKYELK